MKAIVTSNIQTDLDVMNDAQGEIIDSILHPDEPPLGDDPIVTLQHLPSYILVKLKWTHVEQLEGLNKGVISVEVATHSFQIKVRTSNSKYITRSVQCRQFPMTAAYGFTDYYSHLRHGGLSPPKVF